MCFAPSLCGEAQKLGRALRGGKNSLLRAHKLRKRACAKLTLQNDTYRRKLATYVLSEYFCRYPLLAEHVVQYMVRRLLKISEEEGEHGDGEIASETRAASQLEPLHCILDTRGRS